MPLDHRRHGRARGGHCARPARPGRAHRLAAVGLVVQHGRPLGAVAPRLHGPQPNLILREALEVFTVQLIEAQSLCGSIWDQGDGSVIRRGSDADPSPRGCGRRCAGGREPLRAGAEGKGPGSTRRTPGVEEGEDRAHHGLRQVLDKLRKRGVFQHFEHSVSHFFFVIHIIPLVATKLVLCDDLPRGVGTQGRVYTQKAEQNQATQTEAKVPTLRARVTRPLPSSDDPRRETPSDQA